MGQHRPLRAPGGARGVENGGEIVGRARNRRRSRARPPRFARRTCRRASRPRLSTAFRPSLAASSRSAASEAGAADRQRRAGVGEEIFEFGERIGGVERQQRRAGLQAGERQHDHVGRLVDLHGDAVARLDAEIGERARRARPRARTGRRRSATSRPARRRRACRGAARARERDRRDWRTWRLAGASLFSR